MTTLLGKYEVVRELGKGGHGVVLECRHREIGRRVAIKLLKPELCADPDARLRFEREARSAGSLNHDNVAAVYDVGMTDEGKPFLVMEFLEGRDLRAELRDVGRLTTERALDLVVQACRGANAAHENDIIHRDLKPGNLFITRRGDGSELLKILDFGVSKPVKSEAETISSTGSVVGTPHYMSPEQVRGEKLDVRTDVYALGAILYEMLSGQKAHPGDGYHKILYHVMTERPAPLRHLLPDIRSEIADAIEQAMTPDREHRTPTALAFARALVHEAGPVPVSIKTSRSRRNLLLLVSLIGLLGAGLGFAKLGRAGSTAPEPSASVPSNPRVLPEGTSLSTRATSPQPDAAPAAGPSSAPTRAAQGVSGAPSGPRIDRRSPYR